MSSSSQSLIFLNRYFHPDISATSQLASDLVASLATRGWRITVITSAQRYDDPQARLPADEDWHGVRILRVGRSHFGRAHLAGRLLDYASYAVAALRTLWRHAGPDTLVVAMTDPPLLGVPASWICRRRGAPLVQWLQDVLPEAAVGMGALRAGWLTRRLASWRDASLRRSARVVTIGERMAARMAQASGRDIDVIANWALVEEPASAAQLDALRRDWAITAPVVIGYSGNMGRAHRLDGLLDAAAQLRDTPGWQLLLIGGGAQRDELQSRARALQLDGVRFQPYQPRDTLAASLAVADVHVVSLDAALEGLIVPSKFVAALALGRVVLWIGAADGEVGRLVREHDCGLCVRPGDVPALATALRSLIDPRPEASERRRQMAASARALYVARFSRRAALDAWHSLLASTASRAPAAPATTAGTTAPAPGAPPA